MKLKRAVIGPALVAGVAVVSGGWLLQQGVSEQTDTFQQSRIFDEVVQYISGRYVDEHPKPELYRLAVEGLLQELGDPHTSFMSAEEFRDLQIQTTGEYGGLGIEIDQRDGWITVISALPGTPAERAGLQPGDRIIEVEGKSTKGWASDDAVKVLRGPKGQAANIRIARVGVDEPIAFSIVRDEIRIKSVPAAFAVDNGVGYVQLRVFSESATDEVRDAIEQLRKQGAKRVILDLRGNPGGLLDQGAAVSDLFLKKGDAIVETRARDPRQNQEFRAVTDDRYPDVTLAVLVDEYSASASEIVAGALQDNDRALVIGAPSFGKGSVQQLLPLSGGNYLKMTTGRWYTPSGRSIQKEHKAAADATALLEDEPIAEDGAPITTAPAGDTVSRQAFHTVAGRTVYGGGGIVPDVILRQDTLTTVEQEFYKTVSKAGSKYLDVLYRYALEYTRANPKLQPDFQVTPPMRQELFNRLRAAGIEIEAAQFASARDVVNRQLVSQISLDKFGRQAAIRRERAGDRVVRSAAELLRAAPNQQALFQQAQARARAARS